MDPQNAPLVQSDQLLKQIKRPKRPGPEVLFVELPRGPAGTSGFGMWRDEQKGIGWDGLGVFNAV